MAPADDRGSFRRFRRAPTGERLPERRRDRCCLGRRRYWTSPVPVPRWPARAGRAARVQTPRGPGPASGIRTAFARHSASRAGTSVRSTPGGSVRASGCRRSSTRRSFTRCATKPSAWPRARECRDRGSATALHAWPTRRPGSRRPRSCARAGSSDPQRGGCLRR